MAITIDDLPTASVLGDDLAAAQKTTSALLAAITRTSVPVVGFVNERKLQRGGKVDPRRVALLQAWLDQGQELGNHTFSHVDLHRTDLETFQDDVLRGETVMRRRLEWKALTLRYALKDEYVGAAGITWLHRWALTQGKKGIFAGEPTVPKWVEEASK